MSWRFREQAVAAIVSIVMVLVGCGGLSAQPSTLSERVDLLFAEKEKLALAYVDWVFGYSSSYITSYRLAINLLPSVIAEPRTAFAELQRIRSRYYQERFSRMVLQPDEGSDEFVTILKNVLEARLLERSNSIAESRCENQTLVCRRIELERLGRLRGLAVKQVNESEVRVLIQQEVWAGLRESTEVTPGSVRFARPFIVRGSLILVRVTELLSVLLLVAVALRAFYVPVTGITLIIGASLMALMVDYGIHYVDRRLHEGGYAAGVESVLEGGRVQYKRLLVRLIEQNELKFAADLKLGTR